MRKSVCVAVFCFLLALSGSGYSQEHEMEKAPRAREGRPPMGMPMGAGPMGAMMRHRGMGMMMQLMKDNPKLAGIMMQMHGEMMRIRGEEMSKMGDVLKRYGERLEKELAK
jgi:hypothetical protein